MHDFFARIEAALCEAGEVNCRRRRDLKQSPDASRRRAEIVCSASPAAAAVPQSPDRQSESHGRVVLIEGMDLAGKSTLVRNLEAELTRRGVAVRVSRNALCPENPIARVADQLRRDPAAGLLETGALFLASHLWDARHFVPPPAKAIHIQDSCWLRTLAYHTVRGTPMVPAALRGAIPLFPAFHAAFYLTADIAVRERRLYRREREKPGSNDTDDGAVVHNRDLFRWMDSVLMQSAHELANALTIDTSNLSTLELLSRILIATDFDAP